MARRKVHEDGAARQAAYRQRVQERRGKAWAAIHEAVAAAVERGDVPAELASDVRRNMRGLPHWADGDWWQTDEERCCREEATALRDEGREWLAGFGLGQS